MKSLYPAAAALALVSGPAAAQSEPDLSDSILSGLYECRGIADIEQRALCYDAQVDSLKTREASEEIVAVDAAKVRQLERESFGFNLPSLPDLGLPSLGGGDREERAAMTVTDIRSGRGGAAFVMSNGQVWELVDGSLGAAAGAEGGEAEIKKGLMGSYLMTLRLPGRNLRGLRVRRVE